LRETHALSSLGESHYCPYCREEYFHRCPAILEGMRKDREARQFKIDQANSRFNDIVKEAKVNVIVADGTGPVTNYNKYGYTDFQMQKMFKDFEKENKDLSHKELMKKWYETMGIEDPDKIVGYV
jgi:transcriptional regulator with PAS, ATPase and Fis domain